TTDVPNLAGVSNMRGMFQNCASLTTIPNVDLWNTSTITDMQYMFADAKAFNQPLANWNTSNVTNMRFMFQDAVAFNGAVGAWNTANVTNMIGLFSGATAFNQPLTNWNTANVTNMDYMFQDAVAFNGAVGTWNTANVTNMVGLFSGATAFNQPLTNWNTSKVTNMSYMFQNAVAFNGDVGTWNTANVTDMGSMFSSAKVFNKPLTNWNTGAVIRMDYMFFNASAFNGNISNWNTGNVTDMTGMFNGAIAFNQNLSRWCVSKISSQPSGFKNSGSWSVPGWGKCPASVLAQIGKEADNPNTIKSVITVNDLKMIAGITGIVDGYETSYQDYIDENPDEFSNPATVAEVQEMVSSFLFISTWKTTVANETIVIPGTVGEGGATVNWGDGIIQNLAKGASLTHAYTAITPNITISVVGIVEGFGFYNSSTSTASPYSSNILTIEQWGLVKLKTEGYVFRDCSNLTSVPNKFKKGMPVNWDEITTMSDMFFGATKFNGNISSWNTSKVTNMRSMFRGATAFNQDISSWNTGSVTNMAGVFYDAKAFNQNIG
ncbi:MAG: BspA family leucine-rich repeat surface protein, partial [Pedobacter sp.]